MTRNADPTDIKCATGKIGSVNHLRLTVTSIERAKDFYSPILRFMGYHLVECSNTRLAWTGWAEHGNLRWFILSSASGEQMGLPHNRYAPGFHHLAFNARSRTEVDDFYDLLVQNGVNILDAPREYDYETGYYAVFFTDPDGFKLELVHVPEASSRNYWQAFVDRGTPLIT